MTFLHLRFWLKASRKGQDEIPSWGISVRLRRRKTGQRWGLSKVPVCEQLQTVWFCVLSTEPKRC